MELSSLLSTPGVAHHLSPLPRADGNEADRVEQAAKDFESVLLQKLLEQMSRTVGEWGFARDGASEQVQGMFWSLMAQTLADNGGLGLWKQIEQSMNSSQTVPAAIEGVNLSL